MARGWAVCQCVCMKLFFNRFILFIYYYFFWLRWVFRCCAQAFSSSSEQGLLFVAMWGLLIAVASFVAEHRL